AQCHTHKYDPITQTEYYGLMAFLNNADEPVMDVPDAAYLEKKRAAEEKAAKMLADLPEQFPVDEMRWSGTVTSVKAADGVRPRKDAEGAWVFGGSSPDKD